MTAKSELSFPGIYIWKNKVTGAVYVGQAININARKRKHIRDFKHKRHRNLHFQRAWYKYGPDAFEFIVAVDLSSVPEDQLYSELDSHELKILASFTDTYNKTEAANSRHIFKPDTREKLGKRAKSRWSNPEYRKRLTEVHKETWRDEAVKKKHSESLKQTLNTPEHKEKKSKIFKKMWSKKGFKEKRAESLRKAWLDPELRAKQSLAVKNSWIKRRLNKKS